MDGKDAATAAPHSGPQPSSPLAQEPMEEGKGATTAPPPSGAQPSSPLAQEPIEEGKGATTAPPPSGAQPSSPLAQEPMEEGKGATTAPPPLGPRPSSPQTQQPMDEGKDPAASAPQPGKPQPAEAVRWGTRQMGPPAAPGAHPENQQAAQWTASRGDQELPPYVITGEPAQQAPRTEKGKDSPMEHVFDFFNTWSRKAEELSSNIWLNLKTAPSMPDAAMGKLSLGAKAITGGGFDKLYKQTFSSSPDEHLKKTFACYLSTATGPVAGTLYLTTTNVAFCSDRPLSFAAPSGQTAWSYYKVVIPLARVATVEPVTAKESPPERYVHIVTVDSHDFWFMGFVSYDKALHNLGSVVSSQHGAAPAPAPAAAPTPAATYE